MNVQLHRIKCDQSDVLLKRLVKLINLFALKSVIKSVYFQF